MRSAIVTSLLFCAVVGAGAADAPAQTKASSPAKPSAATVAIYKEKCQSCHMPDGAAPLDLMNLADSKWKHGGTRAAVAKVIAEGVPNSAMLAFKDQLTPAQIDALAAYVRSFDKTPRTRKTTKK